MPSDAQPTPACGPTRDALSASLDDEAAALPLDTVRHHLAACGPCAAFEASLVAVHRRVRVAAADEVPDLTAAILTAVRADGRADGVERTRQLRGLVALAGVVQLVVALPVLLGAVAPDLHLGRDLGAFEMALGAGLLLAAWQPRRAAGVLPIAAVATVLATVGGVLDVMAGRASVLAELTHLTELVGVAALWALSRRLPDQPTLRGATLGAT